LDISESISKIELNYEKQNDWDGALSGYEKLLIHDPLCIKILEKIGWCQSRHLDFEAAIATFKQISTYESYNAKWDYMIGFQYYSQKKWKESIVWFKKSIEKRSKYLKARYRLGYALTQCCGTLYRMKSPEFWEALKEFDECEKIWANLSNESRDKEKSTYADVCYQKGKILIERQKWDDAIAILGKAVEIDSKNEDYKYSLGKALHGRARYNEALDTISCIKNTYYVKELKASILYNLKQYDEALKIYLDILGFRKKDYLYRDVSQIYLEKNMLSESYQYALKSIKVSKNNHKNHFLLAKIYYKSEAYHKAKSELENAIEIYSKKYTGTFIEAIEMNKVILTQIEELAITRDDEEILKALIGDSGKETYKGIISKYFPDKGYGFITGENIKCFFHIKQVSRQQHEYIREGCKVEFESIQSNKGPMAVNIKLII